MEITRVKADLQCPFCGHCKVVKVGSHRKAIICPSCQQPVFLSWATGIKGELDDRGCYFKAYEPFKLREINQEFKDAFEEDYPYWLR